MKRKILLAVSGLFFLLFLGMAWFGVNSVVRRLEMTHMESNFKAAEAALRSEEKKFAGQAYRAATLAYQRGLMRGGYYPARSGEYLTAGNCYWQLRQPRAALQCYEEGLRSEPYSIALLTSMGSCAFSLGEQPKALAALKKSRALYPLKKTMRPILRKLRAANKGKNQ